MKMLFWPFAALFYCLVLTVPGKGAENKDDSLTLTILHTNDIHSRILESDKRGVQCSETKRKKKQCFGGVARITHKVRELKRKHLHENPLFLNAGDFYQGTLWYSILKYNIVAAVMPNMSYDDICLGNHEFDDGPEGLVPFIVKMENAHVTVLGTNLGTYQEPLFKGITLPKSKVYHYGDHKVAILGVTTTETNTIAKPGKVRIMDEAKSINREIALIKNKKNPPKIFVLISHVGFDVDQKLALECPDLDLIVGGHTNTFLYTGTPPTEEDKGIVEGEYPYMVNRKDNSVCLIVQDYRFGKYLGFLQVVFSKKGDVKMWKGNPILLNQSVPEDKHMLDALIPYKKLVDEAVNEVVGSTKVLLEASEKLCRYKECNAVNLMADAFFDFYASREHTKKGHWSMVNAAIVNAGIARDSIEPKRNVTLGDLLNAMPYDSDLVILTMTGFQLRNMFEYSVANFTWLPDLNGKFLQVSGARVVYDFRQENGCRVVSLKILCTNCRVPVYEDVRDLKSYSIVTTSFIVNGGDGFQFQKNVTKYTEGTSAVDVFVKYFRKMSPVKTPEEGRVITHNLPKRPNIADKASLAERGIISRAHWRSMRRNFLW